jgi:hypothetical protein
MWVCLRLARSSCLHAILQTIVGSVAALKTATISKDAGFSFQNFRGISSGLL